MSSSCCKNLKLFLSKVTVEPTFFLFASGHAIYQVLFTVGLYEKICRMDFGHLANVNCQHLKDDRVVELAVQRTAAQWKIFLALAYILPVIVAGPIYGAFGDKYGRKNNLLIALCGIITFGAVYVLEICLPHLPLWILVVTEFITASSGFFGLIGPSCFAYLSDQTVDKTSLTVKFTVIQISGNLANILFGTTTGLMLKQMALSHIYCVSMGFTTLSFFYTLIFLEQKPPVKQDKQDEVVVDPTVVDEAATNSMETVAQTSPIQSEKEPNLVTKILNMYISSLQTLVKPREGHFRAYILIALPCFVILNTTQMGLNTVMNLYCLGGPLYWKIQDIAYFHSATAGAVLVGNIIGILVFKQFHFRESSVLLVSILSLMGKMVIVGCANHTWLMYLAAVVGVGGDLMYPACKSLMTQFIDKSEVGKLYALLQLAVDLALLLSHTCFNLIYSATISFDSGFIFLFIAGLLLVPLVAFLWIHFDYSRKQN